jgi:hypothetical protein
MIVRDVIGLRNRLQSLSLHTIRYAFLREFPVKIIPGNTSRGRPALPVITSTNALIRQGITMPCCLRQDATFSAQILTGEARA